MFACCCRYLRLLLVLPVLGQAQDLGFVSEALGTEELEWTLDMGDAALLHEVDVEGGTALDIMVPPNGQELEISAPILGPSVIRFKLKSSGNHAGYIEIDYGGSQNDVYSLPATTEVGGTAIWQSAEVVAASSGNARMILHLAGKLNPDDYIVQLDDMEIVLGVPFRASSIGGTIPEEWLNKVVPPGTVVGVEAQTDIPDAFLLHWKDLDDEILSGENPLYTVVDEPTTCIAVFGRMISWKGYDWLTTAAPVVGFQLVAGEEGNDVLVAEAEAFDDASWIETEIQGPGQLEIDWIHPDLGYRVDSNIPGFSGYQSWFEDDEPVVWNVPEGIHPLRISADGGINLSDLRFTPGFSIKVDVAGNGTVSGMYQGTVVTEGTEVSLAATPDEGWEFAGWTGSFSSSQNTVSFVPTGHTALTAHFVQRFPVPGGSLIVREGDLWTIEETVDGPVIHSPVLTGPGAEAIAYFEYDGPGHLAYEVWTEGAGLFDNSTYTETPYRYDSEFWNEQSWTRAFEASTSSFIGENESGSIKIKNFSWDPGYPVSVSSGGGGHIVGAPLIDRLPAGTVLDLEAVPDPGFVFAGWVDDDFPLDNPKQFYLQNLSSSGVPIIIRAKFGQKETIGVYTVFWDGTAPWTRSGSLFIPPDSLPEDLIAVELVINSADYEQLRLELIDLDPNEPGGNPPVWHKDSGYQSETLSVGINSVSVHHTAPSRLVLSADDNGVFHRYAVRLIGTEYRVNLDATHGSISLDPDVPYWVLEGTEISFTVVPQDGWSFTEWTGELAGSGATGSLIVDRDIGATAVCSVSPVYGPFSVGSDWELEPAGSDMVFLESLEDPYASGFPDGAFTFVSENPNTSTYYLRGTVEGPGVLKGKLAADAYSVHVNSATWALGQSFTVEGDAFAAPLSPGQNEVMIALHTDVASSNPIYLSDLSVVEGFFVFHDGDIAVSPAKPYYEPGERVSLTAIPLEGNRFVGWMYEYAGQPQTFSVQLSKSIMPDFYEEAEDNVGGLTFNFEGIRPTFSNISYFGLSNGFYAYVDQSANGTKSRISTTISGSGEFVLRIDHSTSSAAWYTDIRCIIDGIEMQPWVETPNYTEFRTPLAEDETISLQLEVEFSKLGEEKEGLRLFSFPVVTEEYTLSIESPVRVEQEPRKRTYAPGESVVVTAPDYNQGSPFYAWEAYIRNDQGGGDWAFLSDVPQVNLSMDQSLRLRARYGTLFDFYDGLMTHATESWAWRSNAGPNGSESALVSHPEPGSQAELNWMPDEPVVTDFWIRTIEGRATLSRDGIVVCEIPSDGEWRRVILSHDPSQLWTLAFYAQNSEAEVLVVPTAVIPGAGINTIVHPGGHVDLPDGLAATAGSDLVITAIPDEGRQFYSWESVSGVSNDHQLTVVAGDPSVYQARFTEDFQANGRTFQKDPYSEWHAYDGSISTDLDRVEPRFLSTLISGPATVRYRSYFDRFSGTSPWLRIWLDDTILEEDFPTSESHETADQTIDIPPGDHCLKFEVGTDVVHGHPGATYFVINDLTINEGYRLDVHASGGGVAICVPDKVAYSPGERVQVFVQPDEYYSFTGWYGDAQGTARAIEVNMDGPKVVEAHFTGTITHLGREWTLWNALHSGERSDGDWWIRPGNPVFGAGWIEATFIGPGVLHLAAGPSSTDFSPRDVWMDGTLLSNPWRQVTESDHSPIEMTIPSGAHKIRLSMNEGNLTGINSFSFLPGYQLQLKAPVGGLQVDPSAETYSPGTVVTLQANPHPAVIKTEWVELGESGPGPIQVTMDRSRLIHVHQWRELQFAGQVLQYSGDDGFLRRRSWGDDPDVLFIHHEDADFPGIFQLTTPGAGWISMPYDAADAGSEVEESVEIFVKDLSMGTPLIQGTGVWDYHLIEPDQIVRWEFLELPGDMRINDILFTLVEATPFIDWLKGRVSPEIFRQLSANNWDLDLDEDGISIYLEYLLDMDPLSWERILVAEPQDVTIPSEPIIRLWYPVIPDAFTGKIVVEYTTAPGNPWMPISNHVIRTDIITNQEDISWNQIDLSFGAEVPRTILFRMRYTDELKTFQ